MKKFLSLLLVLGLLAFAVPSTAQLTRGNDIAVTMVDQSAQTNTTNNGSTLSRLGNMHSAFFVLDVTVASAAAGDDLDVYLQTSVDGTIWTDMVAFENVTTSTVQQFARWCGTCVSTDPIDAVDAANIAAGTVEEGPAGPYWRTRAVGSHAGTNAGWTYSVVGYFHD